LTLLSGSNLLVETACAYTYIYFDYASGLPQVEQERFVFWSTEFDTGF
jgi:hypothetical protein